MQPRGRSNSTPWPPAGRTSSSTNSIVSPSRTVTVTSNAPARQWNNSTNITSSSSIMSNNSNNSNSNTATSKNNKNSNSSPAKSNTQLRLCGTGGHAKSTVDGIKVAVKHFAAYLLFVKHAHSAIETIPEDELCDIELWMRFGTFLSEHATKLDVSHGTHSRVLFSITLY